MSFPINSRVDLPSSLCKRLPGWVIPAFQDIPSLAVLGPQQSAEESAQVGQQKGDRDRDQGGPYTVGAPGEKRKKTGAVSVMWGWVKAQRLTLVL